MPELAELHLYFYPFHLIDACFLYGGTEIWNLEFHLPLLSFLSSLISYHPIHPVYPAAFYSFSLSFSSPLSIYLLNLELFLQSLLHHGLLWAVSGFPVHISLADRLSVCLCALFLPWGLQRSGFCPGAHHRARVWLLSTSWRLHQPQSPRSTASPTSELWRWASSFRTTVERLPHYLPPAGWERSVEFIQFSLINS